MPVNVPNPNAYFATVGQHVINLREALRDLVQDGTYLNAMGGSPFLQANLGMTAQDANAFVAIIGAVTEQNATVQQVEAFIASAVTLTGGN